MIFNDKLLKHLIVVIQPFYEQPWLRVENLTTAVSTKVLEELTASQAGLHPGIVTQCHGVEHHLGDPKSCHGRPMCWSTRASASETTAELEQAIDII